jgi:hypothetical protein
MPERPIGQDRLFSRATFFDRQGSVVGDSKGFVAMSDACVLETPESRVPTPFHKEVCRMRPSAHQNRDPGTRDFQGPYIGSRASDGLPTTPAPSPPLPSPKTNRGLRIA